MHYIHSKEGIREALNLRESSQVRPYINKAIKEGFLPFKIICGVEYYDYNQIRRIGIPPNKKEDDNECDSKYRSVLNRNKHVQLLLF